MSTKFLNRLQGWLNVADAVASGVVLLTPYFITKAISKIPSRSIKAVIGRFALARAGRCSHCDIPWGFVPWHITKGAAHPRTSPACVHPFGTGLYSYDADSPLCEECWQGLAPERRREYYERWIDSNLPAIAADFTTTEYKVSPDDQETLILARVLKEHWIPKLV